MAMDTPADSQNSSTFTAFFNMAEMKGDKSYYSDVTMIQDVGWRIGVIHLTSGQGKLGIQLNLVSDNDDDDDDTVESCTASYSLTLINKKDESKSIIKRYTYTFTPGGLGPGYPVFCQMDEFKDTKTGFLDDDNKFTVEASVNITNIEMN